MVLDRKLCLMGLHNINGIPSISRKAELVRLDNDGDIINRVFHCDGLMLCITEQESVVVWNPLISPPRPRQSYNYFMGYEMMNNNTRSRSPKILRFFKSYVDICYTIRSDGYEIYDFKYNSWRTLDITLPDWDMELRHRPRGVSVKGNTYWCHTKRVGFLMCFDFTRENFGPRLSLPCGGGKADNVVLSSVREEKLVVLVERWDTLEMEIWVSSEIESTSVSWSNKVFLTVKKISKCCPFLRDESFLIDEENKLVVFVDKRLNIAYMFGDGGCLGEVDLGEFTSRLCLFFSYVPTSVHIKVTD